MLFSLALACSPIKLSDPTDSAAVDSGLADSGGDSAATDSGPVDSGPVDSGPIDSAAADLHGSVPAQALPVPTFAALNRDGSARSKPDLVGHPTVVWFYPLAGSSG